MNIKGFLSLPHRFRWGGVGGDDCMTFAASWMLHAVGVDPAAGLRGTYSTRAEAHAIMETRGGPLRFMRGKLLAAGCQQIEEALDGDIGLVRMLAGDSPSELAITEVAAIRFGPSWASISPKGVVAQRAEMVAAWRLPN